MSKYDLTERKILRWLKERRGLSELSLYQPWHQVFEIASIGITTLHFGYTTGRHHHLFSLLELYALIMFDWAINVIDIREQFPLLPRRETLDIARSRKLRHPIAGKTKILWVMTTDFLLTVQTPNGFEYIAIAIKPSQQLLKKRVLEKLEIERLYWEARGIKWLVLTEKDMPRTLIKNIGLVMRHFYLEDRGISQDLLRSAIEIMSPMIQTQASSLRDITRECAKILGVENGLVLSMVYHMIATRQWHIDMTKPIKIRRPLGITLEASNDTDLAA